ncbi:MAG TPA: nitronate monooxygenase [Rudaea sp.]|nr:nitronate monooxygenase [Rudaea sp.]
MTTAVTRLLDCEHPILQAPMAGGGDTPALVAAVGQAGGFGFIGAAYLGPQQIAETAASVRAATPRFGINLFAPQATAPPGDLDAARSRLAPYYAEFGLQPPPAPAIADVFEAQLAAALDSGARAISFTFGMPSAAALAAIKQRGIVLVGTATTVAEALALREAGFDAIVAQGSEAGGHRGTFLGDFADAMIGTMALVPQIVDAAGIPVIASGGIMDGRGVAAALALGAGAVQLGTAFLTCEEAGVADAYKTSILHSAESDTRITRAFSGRPARGIVNRFMREVEADGKPIPPFPIQNALTRTLRSTASTQGRAEFLSLWCGQAPRLARKQAAAELVRRLAEETRATIASLGAAR